jgi:hypothetical protein
VKRYFCDRCGKHVDIESDGFAQMRVMWWARGGVDRMEYRPDPLHSDGNEDFMLCAACANKVFGSLDGMEDA